MRYLFVICSLLVATPVYAKLSIVTTTQDLAAITEAVGGDLVSVKSLTRGDQDPHYIEPKPSYARALNHADLVIHVGLDLEVGWLPVLITQSRNASIVPGKKGNLDVSRGLAILEVPTGSIDRSGGDVHPLGNPHYWLDPRNGLSMAQAIAERLIMLDPENRARYEHLRDAFQKRLREKIQKWQRQLKPIKGEHFITYHRTFSYFADWAGLNVDAYIEPKPGLPPSPSHLFHLIELIPREHIRLIMMANYNNPKPGRSIAERTGIRFLSVPSSVGGVGSIKSYTDLFDFLVIQLLEAS